MTATSRRTAAVKPVRNRRPTSPQSETPSKVTTIALPVEAGPSPEIAGLRQIKGKLGVLAGLLLQDGGATLEDMSRATGWQGHSVRGALSGALKTKHGLNVTSEKVGSERVYRIPAEARA